MTTSYTVTKKKASKDKRPKSKKDPDDKILEADLEREYIVKRFYDSCTVTINWVLFSITAHLLLSFYPGMRYFSIVSVLYWAINIAIRKYTQQYKDTKSAEQAMNVYRDLNAALQFKFGRQL